jgi:hypothetical protein
LRTPFNDGKRYDVTITVDTPNKTVNVTGATYTPDSGMPPVDWGAPYVQRLYKTIGNKKKIYLIFNAKGSRAVPGAGTGLITISTDAGDVTVCAEQTDPSTANVDPCQ